MSLPHDQSLVLLHNPACSKSQAAKQWLDGQTHEYVLREYLTTPLDRQELLDLAGRLGLSPRDWVRDGEALAQAAKLDPAAQDEFLVQFLVENPSAMQRPILVRGERARIGRPLEALAELL